MAPITRLFTLGILCIPLFAQADWGRNYGRSMVMSRQGIAATSQTLASQAAAQILARGGSAVDGAIAANAVLAVVEPMMTGPGGDLFVIYWDAKTGKLTGLNASGPAPRALSPEFLARRGITDMPQKGIHSVTVPGAVDGWAKMHHRFGRLPWRDLFQPAIAYAENGFPVPEGMHEAWGTTGAVQKLEDLPESRRVFLPGGKMPETADLFRNPDMGHALRLIAEKGPGAFYEGEIAAAILKTSQRLGGTLTAQDLASYSAEWMEPISIDYRGWRVYEMPPNGQGLAALEMLNLMQQSPALPDGPLGAAEIHQRIEAMKLAYADVHRYDADPRTYKVPVQELLSAPYAHKRAALISAGKANCEVTNGDPMAGDTTYLTVVDRDGNIASWIQSIYSAFGSGVVPDGMGFILQNRGGGFTLDPASPNVLAGGKRPFHTIIPGFMEKGDVHVGFGIMGGPNQPLAHAQFVSNVVDYGMNIQAAMEAPRFFKAESSGCGVSIESRVPEPVLQQLSSWGHEVRIRRWYTPEMGRGQVVMHDSRTGINSAASDPRADGAAIPEPIVR
jgi:gamma-glutamyltranspeptidase/glutathione hydrolase